jgi:SAM-dependent methyltransferase
MDDRPAAVVRRGYDAIAPRYLAERLAGGGGPFAVFLDTAVAAVPEGGVALDLGCGAGDPVTRALAARARIVVGVDLSVTQLGLARFRVPGGIFVQGDMTEIGVRDGSLDAVLAFHSIIHVPRELHSIVLARIHRWLRPGGIFAGTLGFDDNPEERQRDWLGAPMYWSHFDAATNTDLVARAGFVLERSDVLHDEETFLGVIARKPALGGTLRPG